MTNDNDNDVSAAISGAKSAGKLVPNEPQLMSTTTPFTPVDALHTILLDITKPLAQLDIQTGESAFAGLSIEAYDWLTEDVVSELYSQF